MRAADNGALARACVRKVRVHVRAGGEEGKGGVIPDRCSHRDTVGALQLRPSPEGLAEQVLNPSP